MKIKSILYGFFVLLTGSCAKDIDPPQVVKVTETELHFTGNGGSWELTINSNCLWQLSGTTDWCVADKLVGSKTDKIRLTVANNESGAIRSARLLLECDQHQTELTVSQDTVTGSNHHYQLPLIFHILYNDESDSTQYIRSEVITEMIRLCNARYCTDRLDMNLEVVAATNAPDGSPLSEPGIERIKRNGTIHLSCDAFMQDNNTEYTSWLWDPNTYINVFVYTFRETNTLGISHLPYTPAGNSLPGLNAGNYYFTHLPAYAHCISLNNTYINEENASHTLAHELGHYLGLLHTFSQDSCYDSDYCEDTPTYNRTEFERWLQLPETATLPLARLVERTNCEGVTFISENIMDYEPSYFNRFTPNQFARVRHVLENSPLIPGPKNVTPTKAAGPLEIPAVRYLP